MRAPLLITLLLVSSSLTACAARNAEMYRTDTRALLETKRADITTCYNDELKKDEKLGGKVVVRFTVQKDSGKIVDPKIDEKQTTANAALSSCVVKAIDGLMLNPPDKQDGDATFTWQFETKS